MTICRSRALDSLRRREQAQTHPDPDLLRPERQNGSAPPDFLETFEANHALHAAVRKLGNEQRQMIALAFFRDFSHQEITEFVGLPLGTVKSHIRRAQLALRSALGREEASR